MINNWLQSKPVNMFAYILIMHRTWRDGSTPAFLMPFSFKLHLLYIFAFGNGWELDLYLRS